MPQSGIPDGITPEDILGAIGVFRAKSVVHHFHDSEKYDLVHDGERFPPKAIIGIAARRITGRVLEPKDFSGGLGSRCFNILESLGFSVERKPELSLGQGTEFVPGRVYHRRKDIHNVVGGQERGGISTPIGHPYIFLFTGSKGDAYGYRDEVREADGLFLYTGEGQKGDMAWVRGNSAIRDSSASGRKLLLFEKAEKGFVRFVGELEYVDYHLERRPDINGEPREAIIFELAFVVSTREPVEDETLPEVSLSQEQLRRKTLQELRSLALTAGKRTLSPKSRKIEVRNRSEAVKAYVLKRSAGICEGCALPAPFRTKRGEPYLEPHHITRLADGGPDHPAHVVALCPTCHRRSHYGDDGAAYNKTLQEKALELERRSE